MYLKPGNRLSQNEELARNLVLEDPSISIDEIARQLNEQGIALHKGDISRIRLQVRASLDQAKASLATVNAQQPFTKPTAFVRRGAEIKPLQEPFNPPRLVVPKPVVSNPEPVKPEPVPVPTPPPALTIDSLMRSCGTEHTLLGPSLQQKQRWLEDWMLDHPDATVAKAREAVREKFGVGLGTDYIADIVRIAHDLKKEQKAQEEARAKPVVEQVKEAVVSPLCEIADIAQQLKAVGVKKIEVVGEHFVIEMVPQPG